MFIIAVAKKKPISCAFFCQEIAIRVGRATDLNRCRGSRLGAALPLAASLLVDQASARPLAVLLPAKAAGAAHHERRSQEGALCLHPTYVPPNSVPWDRSGRKALGRHLH